MRQRLGAVVVLLTAVLAGLLVTAGTAHAAAADPVCRPAFTNTPDIVCAVPAEFDNRPVVSIEWTKDNEPLPQFDDIRQILLSCEPGQTLVIGLTLSLADDLIPAVGDTPITCPSPPPAVTAFNCSAYGTVTAPFRCDLTWSGGTGPEQVTVSTNGGQGPVTAYPDQNYARVTGSCFPYQITSVTATVTDAAGRRASATRTGFCPRGNF
ncbi:hypothetical protein ACIBH1_12135 [Nonomuraea sp. NPDC050663]|uniref:hypothetical protein n=1 Tax=Nonomuraea sp. NPDC050663 TaxID=3364370 RepID=UPI0037B10846